MKRLWKVDRSFSQKLNMAVVPPKVADDLLPFPVLYSAALMFLVYSSSVSLVSFDKFS